MKNEFKILLDIEKKKKNRIKMKTENQESTKTQAAMQKRLTIEN